MRGTSNQTQSAIPLLEHIDDRLTGCEWRSLSSDNKRSVDIENIIFSVSPAAQRDFHEYFYTLE